MGKGLQAGRAGKQSPEALTSRAFGEAECGPVSTAEVGVEDRANVAGRKRALNVLFRILHFT